MLRRKLYKLLDHAHGFHRAFVKVYVIAVSNSLKPDYNPEETSIPNNYNVLQISEIHAFEEPEWRKDLYLEDISRQINEYSETYSVNEVWILGDTGSLEDVQTILSGLEPSIDVKLVAGDEDKKDDVCIDEGKNYTGWFASINDYKEIGEGVNIDASYEIFDEAFEKEIKGTEIQAAHHPNKEKRPNSPEKPDKRDRNALKNYFSVFKETNENTLTDIPPPSLKNADMFIYDHVHMPYPRNIGDKAVIGRGGRRNNHAIGSDCIPETSIHLTSFGDRYIQDLHFDADLDAIFEHLVFDSDDGYEIYQVPLPQDGTHSTFYKPVQVRFHKDQYNHEAEESEEDHPEIIDLAELA